VLKHWQIDGGGEAVEDSRVSLGWTLAHASVALLDTLRRGELLHPEMGVERFNPQRPWRALGP
jgi:hypothetical protein